MPSFYNNIEFYNWNGSFTIAKSNNMYTVSSSLFDGQVKTLFHEVFTV